MSVYLPCSNPFDADLFEYLKNCNAKLSVLSKIGHGAATTGYEWIVASISCDPRGIWTKYFGFDYCKIHL